MERITSQKNKIKQHLEDKQGITPMDALRLYGCFRLSAIILKLKEEGMKIVTVLRSQYREDGNKHGIVQFAEYWLESRFKKEHAESYNFNLANSGANMPVPKAYFMKTREYNESNAQQNFEEI